MLGKPTDSVLGFLVFVRYLGLYGEGKGSYVHLVSVNLGFFVIFNGEYSLREHLGGQVHHDAVPLPPSGHPSQPHSVRLIRPLAMGGGTDRRQNALHDRTNVQRCVSLHQIF